MFNAGSKGYIQSFAIELLLESNPLTTAFYNCQEVSERLLDSVTIKRQQSTHSRVHSLTVLSFNAKNVSVLIKPA